MNCFRPGRATIINVRFRLTGSFHYKDQLISVAAYVRKSEKPVRDEKAEHALESVEIWKLDRSYLYNPLLLASRNRADVLLTVIKPSRK